MRARVGARTVAPVSPPERRTGLFPALLKHWRGQRGLSQLDLALAAEVSSRHLSFLETGRSRPSAEMVLRLGATLGVPLRDVDAMLEAAGHDPLHRDEAGATPPAVRRALEVLKSHQEPYPLVVMDTAYDVADLNGGATALFAAVLGGPERLRGALDGGLNLARLTFDPDGAHPFLVNADEVGRALLWRLQREVLADPHDTSLRAVLDDVLAMPTVDRRWRDVDLSVPADPVLVVRLRAPGGGELRFLTMLTSFQAPQNTVAERLRVESWFPADDETAGALWGLAAHREVQE